MKKILLTALMILGLSGLSFAYTAVNTGKITPSYQKVFGGYNTTGGGMFETSQAQVITGIALTAGTSANTMQMWDVCSLPVCANSASTANVQNSASTFFEASVAANTTQFFDFSQTPIRTINGIEASSSNAGGGGYLIYTVQYS